MSPGITLKIFAIAASILVLLLAIAINTHGKINIINREVKALSESILPVSEQIHQAIIATLEQEIHLERVLRLAEQVPAPATEMQRQIADFNQWADIAQQHFSQANSTLSNPNTHGLAMLPSDIKDAVSALHMHNQAFQENAQSASQHQQQILWQNLLLTLFAIAVGLLYSWFLVKRLSRPIEQLNQQVKNALQTEETSSIPIKSRDEVGTLTRQFNRVMSHLKHSEQLKDMFGQYLDPGLISHIETGKQHFKLDGEKQSVTVLLTYIDNLDWQSEEFSAQINDNPQKMVQAINQYLHLQTAEMGQFKGIVNFTLTDILVFWSHPFVASHKHVPHAGEVLVKQIQGLEKFKTYLKQHFPGLRDPDKICLRAGLASGELVVANMGPAGARAFTVIGDEVNAASRKAGIARYFGINAVLSEHVARQLGDDFTSRPLGNLMVPGKEDIIRAAQFMGKTRDLSPLELGAIASFKAGFSAFHQQQFTQAAAEFQKTLQVYDNDEVSKK